MCGMKQKSLLMRIILNVLGELKKRIFTWGNDIYNWISKYKANYSSSESPYNV